MALEIVMPPQDLLQPEDRRDSKPDATAFLSFLTQAQEESDKQTDEELPDEPEKPAEDPKAAAQTQSAMANVNLLAQLLDHTGPNYQVVQSPKTSQSWVPDQVRKALQTCGVADATS